MHAARRWITSRPVRFTAALGLTAAGLGLGTADAATPTEGTVSDTSHRDDLGRRAVRRPERHRRRARPARLHACRSPATTSRCTSRPRPATAPRTS